MVSTKAWKGSRKLEAHIRLKISHDKFLTDPLLVQWMPCRVRGLGTVAEVVLHHRLVWFYAHVTQISRDHNIVVKIKEGGEARDRRAR